MNKQQIKLIVGLGNPGKQYEQTRHNLGFELLDHVVKNFSSDAWQTKDKLKARIAPINQNDQKIIFAKPTTFYNLSGEAVQAIVDFYKIDLQDLLVIHDELDLPFGTIRTRIGGSDAHNNGIKNLIAHIGPDFARIRVGTSNQQLTQQDAADFVLSRLTPEEQKQFPQISTHVQKFVTDFIHEAKTFSHDSVRV